MKQKHNLRILIAAIAALAVLGLAPGAGHLGLKARPATVRVNCDNGETISGALGRKPGQELVIAFRGTCEENVVINRGSLTLLGLREDAAVIGSIVVSRAHDVLLEDFAVRNSSANAMLVAAGSAVSITDVVAEDNAASGLVIEASQARLENVVLRRNAEFGLIVGEGASVAATGLVSSTDNGLVAALITEASSFVLTDFEFEASRSLFGLVIQSNSNGSFVGGRIRTVGNFFVGILMAGGGVLTEGFTVVEVMDNDFAGAALTDSSSWLTFDGTGVSRVITGNGGIGIRAESDSTLDFRGSENTISDNGEIGLVLDNASGRLEGITASGQSQGDLFLEFGSRATFFGTNDIAFASCDDLSLIRGVDCTLRDSARHKAALPERRLGAVPVPPRSRP